MKKGLPRTAAAVSALLILFPVAVASAGPYATTSVRQASSTSPFASCDISGIHLPGRGQLGEQRTRAVRRGESERPVEHHRRLPAGPVQLRRRRGLAASVSHDGGLTWSATYPHFTTCSGGTAANHGDYQRASDPWVTFSPDGTAYFISLSLTFVGDASQTGSAVLVSKSTDGGDTWSDPVHARPRHRRRGRRAVLLQRQGVDHRRSVRLELRLRDLGPAPQAGQVRNPSAENSFAFRGDTLFARTTDGGKTWEPARTIYAQSSLTGTIGNEIAVLPDGTLVDVFDILQGSGKQRAGLRHHGDALDRPWCDLV